MSKRVLFWAFLTGFLALDQGVKAWIRGSLALNQSLDAPWPGVFEIKHVTNEGIAFGMFQGMGVMLAPIAIGIAIFAILYSQKHPHESGWTHTAMALLAAGALGNLYDRVFLGGVTDMFWFRAIDFPVFNIADACITGATMILIVKWGLEALPSRKSVLADVSFPASDAVEGDQPLGPALGQEHGEGEDGQYGRYEKFLRGTAGDEEGGGSEQTEQQGLATASASEEESSSAGSETPQSTSTISDVRQVESSDPETETSQAQNQS